MNRRGQRKVYDRQRVPRVSGDEPGLVIGASSNDESSPRKRGGASLGVGLIPL